MSAEVIDFERARARRTSNCAAAATGQAASAATGMISHDFTFWRGATGARYVHTIYSLLHCPDLPNANVLLIKRHASGRAEVMHIGRVENDAGCANLAEIRHTAAKLGATEVHVHLLAANREERIAIERDLSGAGEIASAARH